MMIPKRGSIIKKKIKYFIFYLIFFLFASPIIAYLSAGLLNLRLFELGGAIWIFHFCPLIGIALGIVFGLWAMLDRNFCTDRFYILKSLVVGILILFFIQFILLHIPIIRGNVVIPLK